MFVGHGDLPWGPEVLLLPWQWLTAILLWDKSSAFLWESEIKKVCVCVKNALWSLLIDRFKKYKQAGSHSNSFRLTNGRSDDTGKSNRASLVSSGWLCVCVCFVFVGRYGNNLSEILSLFDLGHLGKREQPGWPDLLVSVFSPISFDWSYFPNW